MKKKKVIRKKVEKIICPECNGRRLDVMDMSMMCSFCDGKGWVNKNKLKGTMFENVL